MALLPAHIGYIEPSIEHLFYDLPENIPDLRKRIAELNTLFTEAFATNSTAKIRPQKAGESDDDYEIFITVAKPNTRVLLLEKKIGACTISEAQQGIYFVALESLQKAWREAIKLQSMEADQINPDSAVKIADIFPQPLINIANNIAFETVCPKQEHLNPFSWDLNISADRIFNAKIIIREQRVKRDRIDLILDLSYSVTFPKGTFSYPIIPHFRPFPACGSDWANDEKQKKIMIAATLEAERLAGIKAVKYLEELLAKEQFPLPSNWPNAASYSYNLYYAPQLSLITRSRSARIRLLTFKYYFDLVATGKVTIEEFNSLIPDEIRALRTPNVIELQKNGICDFQQARSLLPHIISLLEMSVYRQWLATKSIPFNSLRNLTVDQCFILRMPQIQNLLLRNPNINFFSIINIMPESIRLFTEEFYSNLLAQGKIEFHSLQRTSSYDADVLLMPEMMKELSSLRHISSAFLNVILNAIYTQLIFEKKIRLLDLENITNEQAAMLLLPNIAALIAINILPLETALLTSYERMKILSGAELNLLLRQGHITLSQAFHITDETACIIECNKTISYYLRTKFFNLYTHYDNVISIVVWCEILFHRLDALVRKEPQYVNTTADNPKYFTHDFVKTCNVQDISANDLLTCMVILQLVYVKARLSSESHYPVCVDIVARVNYAERINSREEWWNTFQYISDIAVKNPRQLNAPLPFMTGGPTYCRAGQPVTTYSSTFFPSHRVSCQFELIKGIAAAINALNTFTLKNDEQPLMKMC